MNMSFPSRRHGISPLEHQASRILEKYFLLVFSPLGDLSLPLRRWYSLSDVISFDVISLSPFDINFQEGFFGICRMGLVLESQNKAASWMWCWYRTRIIEWSWSKKKHRISGKLFFLLWNRWHQGVGFGGTESFSVGPKVTNQCNRVHRRGNTCHLSSLD